MIEPVQTTNHSPNHMLNFLISTKILSTSPNLKKHPSHTLYNSLCLSLYMNSFSRLQSIDETVGALEVRGPLTQHDARPAYNINKNHLRVSRIEILPTSGGGQQVTKFYSRASNTGHHLLDSHQSQKLENDLMQLVNSRRVSNLRHTVHLHSKLTKREEEMQAVKLVVNEAFGSNRKLYLICFLHSTTPHLTYFFL